MAACAAPFTNPLTCLQQKVMMCEQERVHQMPIDKTCHDRQGVCVCVPGGGGGWGGGGRRRGRGKAGGEGRGRGGRIWCLAGRSLNVVVGWISDCRRMFCPSGRALEERLRLG